VILRAACIQANTGGDVDANLKTLTQSIREAAAAGATFIATPENSDALRKSPLLPGVLFAEAEHPFVPAFSDLARDLNCWVLLGSIAVKAEDGRRFNRSLLFNAEGEIAARYDKLHLFSYNGGPGETYDEAATCAPGDQAILAQTPWGGLGLTICYDLRFAALYRALAQAGAALITVPSAFTVPTGTAHWHVLLRARAIETGCYILAPAQTGTHEDGRKTYGHSLIVSPWGEVLKDAGTEPGMIVADLDLDKVAEARKALPSLKHDREFKFKLEGDYMYPCPCCGYLVHDEPPGSYNICKICFWEDDISQLRFPEMAGGANGVSLIQAQKNFVSIGACEERIRQHVRQPLSGEERDPTWRPIDPQRDFYDYPNLSKNYLDLSTEGYPEDTTRLYYWRR
jgi:predicted amidohydrolase